MFSRFSPAARRVLRAAEQECRNHNHYYVGVEHLLFALLEEGDPEVDAAVRAEGLTLGDLHAELKRALGTGDDRVWEGILLTPRVRRVVRAAEERRGDGDVEPIDLFEAIRAERGGLVAEIFARARNMAKAVQ